MAEHAQRTYSTFEKVAILPLGGGFAAEVPHDGHIHVVLVAAGYSDIRAEALTDTAVGWPNRSDMLVATRDQCALQ